MLCYRLVLLRSSGSLYTFCDTLPLFYVVVPHPFDVPYLPCVQQSQVDHLSEHGDG